MQSLKLLGYSYTQVSQATCSSDTSQRCSLGGARRRQSCTYRRGLWRLLAEDQAKASCVVSKLHNKSAHRMGGERTNSLHHKCAMQQCLLLVDISRHEITSWRALLSHYSPCRRAHQRLHVIRQLQALHRAALAQYCVLALTSRMSPPGGTPRTLLGQQGRCVAGMRRLVSTPLPAAPV